MKNEEKELLVKDLCARLPYGVYVEENRENPDPKPVIYTHYYHPFIEDCKPYIRPMSSMTEEEIAKLMVELCVCKKDIQNCGHTEIYGYTLVFQQWEKKTFFIPSGAMDYLNSHHLDYRGLIKKGMALEAPEGMYDIK